MHDHPSIKSWIARGLSALAGAVLLMGWAPAQEAVQVSPNNAWQGYDWLAPAVNQKNPASPDETSSTTVGQDMKDPFTVLSTGSLWQDKYDSLDTRRLADTLTLSCESGAVTLDGDSDDLAQAQKLGFQFQPVGELTLCGDLHDSESDALLPSQSTTSTGASLGLEGHLPLNGVLTLGLRSDRSFADAPACDSSTTNACDAQLQQPLGKLPLTAVLKSHYEGTSVGNAPPTSLPSLEQSLVWKPLQDTTFQAGLRQQHYQEYPGVDHELNEALFADWSQQVVDDVTWHSYAEVLNTKGLLDQAPGAPIASGANGTAQATTPGSNASLTSSLPVSIDDQTLTFSTGPSFRLEKDISASVEYSDRWDKNPAPGSTGEEQRVSVSVKGTF